MKQLSGSHRIILGSHYILTTPTRLSDMDIEGLDDDIDYALHEKSLRLQTRRWRKIQHQEV